jgi:hypothetical protein
LEGVIGWLCDNKVLILHGVLITAIMATSLYYGIQQYQARVGFSHTRAE